MRQSDRQPVVCYLGLGSNLGNKLANIQKALFLLRKNKGLDLKSCSSVYETAPRGGPKGQGNYLNAVCEIDCRLAADQLLKKLKEIEKKIGRKASRERWGPREIDLDILCCADLIIKKKDLEIPHPRLQERFFVLKPLSELAPHWQHPVLGIDVIQMLVDLKEIGKREKINESLE